MAIAEQPERVWTERKKTFQNYKGIITLDNAFEKVHIDEDKVTPLLYCFPFVYFLL